MAVSTSENQGRTGFTPETAERATAAERLGPLLVSAGQERKKIQL